MVQATVGLFFCYFQFSWMSVCRSSSFYVWIVPVPRGICPCKNNFCPCRRLYLSTWYTRYIVSRATCYQYGTATMVLLRGPTWKALKKYGFEFKNFGSVISLVPDFYRDYFEPLEQKHGLFKIDFCSKKHPFVTATYATISYEQNYIFWKNRSELWILMML